MQVRRRLVIHVQGFDPRLPADYCRAFTQEYRRTCELYGLKGEVGDVEGEPDASFAAWPVTTDGAGWQVETDYRMLRWDDMVREDMTRPAWWKIVQMYRTTGVSMLNGAFGRILRLNWRFAVLSLAPLLLITAWILLATFFGLLCMNLVAALHAPEMVARTVGGVTGVGGFGSLLWLTEPLSRLLLRCDRAATTDQYANRKRPELEKRLDALAAAVVKAISASKAEEAVVVGHGFGAVIAADVLARALGRDRLLGRHGPRVALLTLGAVFPVVGFDPEAKAFRDRLRRLVEATDIDWIDVQSPDDLKSFSGFDPAAAHGIAREPGQDNPRVVTVRLRDLWKEAGFGLRRWQLSRVHRQFLMANERRGAAYDYTLICCGPLDLVSRATDPAAAVAAMAA
jgi:pimeloyl-ACP methyl ester carboxylesterase